MTDHRSVQVTIAGESFPVDEQVAELVCVMNDIAFDTLSSCQGDPGVIGEGGKYGHVTFRFRERGDLVSFCMTTLPRLFGELIEDELGIQIEVRDIPFGWLYFRNESLPYVTATLREYNELLNSGDKP